MTWWWKSRIKHGTLNIKKISYGLLLSALFLQQCGSEQPGNSENKDMANNTTAFDWQGHRGCRGLYPENTIPAFLHALSFPAVTTLELDVVMSQDQQVIVSHEPWMNPLICLAPDGQALADTSKVALLQRTAEEIRAYDCGSLGHPRFPEQQKMVVAKPSLAEVFAAVAVFCQAAERPLPRFNIELKYLPEWEADGLVPNIPVFVAAVLAEIAAFGQPELVNLQCFHPPVLAHIRSVAADISLAYLDEFPQQGTLREKMAALGFVPPIYSPYFVPLTPAIVDSAQQLGMRVIPWTVNEVADLQRVKSLGVEGIITDYPDRIGDF